MRHASLLIAACALLPAWSSAQVVFRSLSVHTADGQIHSHPLARVDSVTFDTVPSRQANRWYHLIENPGIADYLRDFDYDPTDYGYHHLFRYRGEPYLDARQDWPYGVTLGDTTYYNLRPDTTYTLLRIDEGTRRYVRIHTLGQLRMIRAEGIDNVRDLGGWPTASGRRVRYGLLFRGVEPNTVRSASALSGARSAHQVTMADVRMLRRQLGIRAELDLRDELEVPRASRGVSALGSDIAYANIPILYGEIIGPWQCQQLLACFRFVTEQIQASHPVYIHCVWGADRTGLLCFLLEGLLGVGQSNLDKDYELTSFSGNTRYRNDTAYLLVLRTILALDGTTLQDKFRTWWRMAGATDDELNQFIETMTE